MKKKRIAMLLVATLTFSQSMGAVIPVAAEELTADTGQETAETEESEEIVQENDASETTGEAASVPDLEDDEELSLQDDAENAEEEIAEGAILGFPLTKEDGKRDINVVYNRSFQLSHLSEKFVKTVKEIYRQKAQCLQKVGE